MAIFCKGISRLSVVSAALAAFILIPPEVFGRGPDVCLWKHMFHVAACPACGSTRALAAFFHGRPIQALAYNRNVLVTAPTLVAMMAHDMLLELRTWLRVLRYRLENRRGV